MAMCARCEGRGMVRANYHKDGKYVFHKEPCKCKAGLIVRLQGAELEAARLREELEHEEESHAGTVAQRDSAEACVEALLDVLGLKNGRDYEWSNAFGFLDAADLAQQKADGLREELERVRKAQSDEETIYVALAAWINRTKRSLSQMDCFIAGWQDCAVLQADTTKGASHG